MRIYYTKNQKLLRYFIIFIFIIIIIFFIFSKVLYSYRKILFIDSISIKSLIDNNNTDIIYSYFLDRDLVYCFDTYNLFFKDKNKEYIKKYFPDIFFVGKIRFFIYSIFFRSSIVLYSFYDDILDYAFRNDIKYIKVVLDINSIDDNEYITLRDSNNKKILLSITNSDYYTNFYNYKKKLNKNLIRVVDGDTIEYNNIYYRFIGIDAPELSQKTGKKVKNYLIKRISNTDNVYIIVSNYDIFGRVLCHLIVDDNHLLSYDFIREKKAKETITKYGDSGFYTIATNILYLSKYQGRRDFSDPYKFRKR